MKNEEFPKELYLLLGDIKLTSLQLALLEQSWQGDSYDQMAQRLGYNPEYLKNIGSVLWRLLSNFLGLPVSKSNCRSIFKSRLARAAEEALLLESKKTREPDSANNFYGLESFVGRESELGLLKRWITQERCSLVGVTGIGGVGKTTLSMQLAERLKVQQQYRVIWQTLRDVPSPHETFITLVRLLGEEEVTASLYSTTELAAKIASLLSQRRCLLVLDNFDTLLQDKETAGRFKSGFEDYGELLDQVSTVCGDGCLLLTSRELPLQLESRSMDNPLKVRSLRLSGLAPQAVGQLLSAVGLDAGQSSYDRLARDYQGNPLALKVVSITIQELYSGDVEQFLLHGPVAYGGIAELLDRQLERLSKLERAIIFWLAILREPVSPIQLKSHMVPAPTEGKLLDAFQSLAARALVERDRQGCTLQPVIMEHITDLFLNGLEAELLEVKPGLFLEYPLLMAQAKEYIRESQWHLILLSLAERLQVRLGSHGNINRWCSGVLGELQLTQSASPGYGAGNLLNLMQALEIDAGGKDFTRLTIRQACLRDVQLHRARFDGAVFRDCAFAETFGSVTDVSFSPDGQLLASTDSSGSIQVRLNADGRLIHRCIGHNNWVWQASFSPDSRLLASCSSDQTVRIWDTHSGNCLCVMEGHTSITTATTFHPTAPLVASSSEDATIRLWDVRTGECIQILSGHTGCIWAISFAPDGNSLFSASEDLTIREWDFTTGKCLRILEGHTGWVKALVLSPDGKLLASGSFDRTVRLWALEGANEPYILEGHTAPVVGLAFNSDGNKIASASYDKTVRLWDIPSQKCSHVLERHTNRVWSVSFHPDGKLLASGGDDHCVRLWDVRSGRVSRTFLGHSNGAFRLGLSPDGKWIASGHEDQTVRLWAVEEQDALPLPIASLQKTLRGHGNRVFGLAFGPDTQWVASASLDGTVRIWEMSSGRCLRVLEAHKSWIWSMVCSQDGQMLATASYDHTVRLWEVRSGRCLGTLEGHGNGVLSVAFSPDGKAIASGGYAEGIRLWDRSSGRCVRAMSAHGNRVWALTFDADGKILATGGDDGTICLWDVVTGKCLRVLKGHTDHVLSLVYDTENHTLLSSSADRTIRQWCPHSGQCLQILSGHSNWVWSLATDPLSPDRLYSCSQDETIRLWDLRTGECLRFFQVPRPYEGMDITKAGGLNSAQRATLIALGAIERT
jgi:WD40 repeat protein